MKTGWILAAAILVFALRAEGAQIPVFVVAGQSNAVGAATNTSQLTVNWQATQPNVLYSGPQESAVNWHPLTPPTQVVQITSPSGFGPEVSVGKTISDALGGQLVGQTKFAINGTNLHTQWNPGIPGSLYHQMLARVDTALTQLPVQNPGTTGKVAGFFWMQGESDGLDGRSAVQYEADLTNFIAQVRTDFNDPNLPFIIGKLSGTSGYAGSFGQIRIAQENVAAADSFVAIVDTDALPIDGDGIHYTSQGTVDMGIAFGNAYLQVVPEPSSLLLAVLGLVGLCGWGLRRRRK